MNDDPDREERIVREIKEIVEGGVDKKAPARVADAAESKGKTGVAEWIRRNLAKYIEHLVKGDFED